MQGPQPAVVCRMMSVIASPGVSKPAPIMTFTAAVELKAQEFSECAWKVIPWSPCKVAQFQLPEFPYRVPLAASCALCTSYHNHPSC